MRQSVGPYRILETLGRGGMGIVYRGVHNTLGRQVAIKALAPELTQDPQFRERFFSEARTQAHLQHPNIITIYDLLEDEGEFFIVMELVKGRGLDRKLEAGRLPREEARQLFVQILSALDFAHSQGVIHRDVKSSNVLVTEDGRVKLMDFGIALLVGDKRLTQSSQTIGTPVYMSPEQILRPREVDHRTDIYSAGILFYEMLTGSPPFDAETEYEIKKHHIETPFADVVASDPDVPEELARVLGRALAKDPDERFDSAGALLRALPGDGSAPPPGGGAAAGIPAPPPPPHGTRLDPAAPSRRPVGSWLRELKLDAATVRRYLPWLAAAAVVVLVGLGWIVIGLVGGSTPEGAERVVLEEADSPGRAPRIDPGGGSGPGDDGRPVVIGVTDGEDESPEGGVLAAEGDGRAGVGEDRPGTGRAGTEDSARPEAQPSRQPPTPPPPRPRARPQPEAPAPSPPPPPPPPPPPEPVPEPEPSPASDPDAVLAEAGGIARTLADALERFEDIYEDRLDNVEDTDRSILETADYDLEDQLETLAETAEELKEAYNAIASRENLDGKKGLVRWARGRFGSADRDMFWQRAEQTVALGRGAAEYVDGAGSVDPPTRAVWDRIQADLDRLERLVRRAAR